MQSPRILVTGAAGFLGAAITADLISRDVWPHVRLQLRADSHAHALERVREALARFEVPAAQVARLDISQVMLGDLNDPDSLFADPGLDEVTHVINCAALATFSNNPALWRINVEGTFAFAKRLSEIARLQRFVQVGTAMCVGPDAPSPVPEGYDPDTPIRHLVPYSETKIEVERKLLRELPQLPLVQARPAIIVGHSRLGTRPSGSIFWVFRTAQLLERFTVCVDDRIDVIPVDWAARTLVELTLKPELRHRFYHLSAGPQAASTFRELDVAMAEGRCTEPVAARYRQASLEELEAMSGEYQARLGPCHPRIMQRAIRLYGTFAALGMTFRNENLVEEGLAPPPPFASYAALCAATSEGVTIADQMMADFK